MIRPEQVPKEVADALWQAICDKPGIEPKKAIAAALNAWPGMHLGAPWVIGVPNATSIILPLTEKPDDKA